MKINKWYKYLAEENTPGTKSYSYSQNLISFLKQEEGFSDIPYKKKGDRPTIGYGTTFYVVNGKEIPVTLKDKPITPEEGERLMINYLNKKVMPSLNKYLKNAPMNQNQIDALVSVMYNMGNKGFLDTQLFSTASVNPNDPNIAKLFLADKIATVGGQVSPGLKNRRKKELELFMGAEGLDYASEKSVVPQPFKTPSPKVDMAKQEEKPWYDRIVDKVSQFNPFAKFE